MPRGTVRADPTPCSPEPKMNQPGTPNGMTSPRVPSQGGAYTDEETYRATRLPVDRALTLTPEAYRSPGFHAVEREMVVSRGWVCVGYNSQLERPGDILVATVAGQPILVARDRSGSIRAFYNVCRHRGSMLVCEDGHHEVIRCPYHSWGYGLDGRLLGAPYFKGLDVSEAERAAFDMGEARGFRKEDYGLLPVRAEAWGCFVFVSLDPDARSLAEWLGDLPGRLARHPLADLRLVSRKSIEVGANWKLVAEEFMAYYTLLWVHTALNTGSNFGNHERYQGPGMYTGMCTTPLTRDPSLPIDVGVLPAMPGLDARDAATAYWILLVPNLALFLLPNHLFTLLFRPDG